MTVGVSQRLNLEQRIKRKRAVRQIPEDVRERWPGFSRVQAAIIDHGGNVDSITGTVNLYVKPTEQYEDSKKVAVIRGRFGSTDGLATCARLLVQDDEFVSGILGRVTPNTDRPLVIDADKIPASSLPPQYQNLRRY